MRRTIITPNQVGEIMRGRRKARGISQQTLATKLGIAQSRISGLEADPASLTLDRLLTLTKLLGLELVLQDKSDARKRKEEW